MTGYTGIKPAVGSKVNKLPGKPMFEQPSSQLGSKVKRAPFGAI